MTLTQTLPKAWKAFSSHKEILILVLLLEAVFFIGVVRLHYQFFLPTTDAALKATGAMQQEMQNTPDSELASLDDRLAENDEFMSNYLVLVQNIGFFLLGLLALWIVVRGPLWYLSHRTVKDVPFNRTWAKFAGMTLFWAAISLAALLGYSILEGSTATILPVVSSTTASVLFILVFLVIAYFQDISFALLPDKQMFKNTFRYGVKQAKKAVPVWIVSALISFIALTLPINWLQSAPQASLAIYALVTVPLLHFARINLIIPWSKQ